MLTKETAEIMGSCTVCDTGLNGVTRVIAYYTHEGESIRSRMIVPSGSVGAVLEVCPIPRVLSYDDFDKLWEYNADT